MSQFGSGIGGLHSDVLNANPSDQATKDRLIDEIKTRAKGSLSTKNYPEAVALYSKAIELRPDDAILFANRSMCQLGMSKSHEALCDAEKAIELDSTYVKGYYRRGMALVSQKKYSVARDALRKGLDLAPGDKSFISQLDKLRGEAYQHDGATTTTASSSPPMPKLPAKTVTSAPPVKREKTPITVEKGSSTKASTDMRGYKTTSDGRKTTFFNNELDEKTKELIGDITPKQISAAATDQEVASTSKGSAWNTAGTFESVTYTPWAIERIETLLNGIALCIIDG
jgi:tetratricopeptide (TPR) repeat protein